MISSCLEDLAGRLNGLNDDEVLRVLRQIEEFSLGMVGPRRAMTGQSLPPRLPATAAALAAGAIGTGQLKVITETMVLMPGCSRVRPRARRGGAHQVRQ